MALSQRSLDDLLAKLCADQMTYTEAAQLLDSAAMESQVPLGDFLDLLSIVVARRYQAGRMDYDDGDAIMNRVFAAICIVFLDGPLNEFPAAAEEIYYAFDEGEYYHKNNRDEDPEIRYTKPMIEAALARFGDRYDREL